MELWIRSQDGNILIKANNICVTNEFNDTYNGFEYYIWTDEQVIGIYKTKERALQILDEIQNILQPRIIMKEPEIDYDDMINSLTDNIMLKTTQRIDMELKEAGQVCYKMPKE